MLSNAASDKIKTLNFADEIEVMLGFIVAFSAEFTLPVQMNSMLYGHLSNMHPEDIYETRKKITNKPFTQETKAFYKPLTFSVYYEGRARDPLAALDELPEYEPTDTDKALNNDALKQFILNSPAMSAWLARKNPDQIESVEEQAENKIEQEQKKLWEELEAMDALDPQDTKFEEKNRALMQRYNNVSTIVKAQLQGELLTQICKKYGADITL
jgi:hypothetical protein